MTGGACPVPGHSSSSDWWSVRSPYWPVRSSPSMTGVPPGCGSQLLRHQQTACTWWDPCVPLSWLWDGQGWNACHLSGYESRFLLLLCLRHVLTTGHRKSQRALEQGRSLVWRHCGFRMAPRSCHWTALFPSCQYWKTRSCSAVWVGNRSLGEPLRGRLCWPDQTPYSTGILWPKVGQPPTNCNRSKFNGYDILNISWMSGEKS